MIKPSKASVHVFQQLHSSRATLAASAGFGDQMQLARWKNNHDHTHYHKPGHHTLSCYLDGGYQMQRVKRGQGLKGGAPGRICLMPEDHESEWLVGDAVDFMHLYFEGRHLKQLAEKISDKECRYLQLEDLTFTDDLWISNLCQQLILPLDWQDKSDQLALENASQMLMLHLIKQYGNIDWKTPQVRGGLAPSVLRKLTDYIDQYLDQKLTVTELAQVAQLSEYHLCRMFKQSTGQTLQQFVMQQRLETAKTLLLQGNLSVQQVALNCGFSSASHFSKRFSQKYQKTPNKINKGE
ncbi:helix-turn-helix domain-containing protein [Pelagibaculum spongiae]|uniref:AraC family transcriptional regulator n=1 Tax=Pelagibaculum spongiae TaxID=2080658 RepID=A0A2V1GXA0_9GAMM|nr:helix-turn-helix transcriptional regulator [Pelagibaculum spongiae]PVZ66325.1 AraC family transcriptional regulator [Pelagibaculum spongiae]